MRFSGRTASLTRVPSHHGIVPAIATEGLLLYPATCMRVRRMALHEEDGLEGCVLYDGPIRRPPVVKLQKQTGQSLPGVRERVGSVRGGDAGTSGQHEGSLR